MFEIGPFYRFAELSDCERVNYTAKCWFPQGSGITESRVAIA